MSKKTGIELDEIELTFIHRSLEMMYTSLDEIKDVPTNNIFSNRYNYELCKELLKKLSKHLFVVKHKEAIDKTCDEVDNMMAK